MDDERVVRTWYRSVVIQGNRMWCESRDEHEVLLSAHAAPGPVRFETFSVVEYETPWSEYLPSLNDLAEAKRAYEIEEREFQLEED